MSYRPTLSDTENEARMRHLLDQIRVTISTDEKRILWNQYSQLHATRSPELVEHMERERGLYRG